MKTLSAENFEQKDLPFKINRLSPNIGAELLDIDLRQDLDKKTYQSIYQALLTYKVIFFREQNLTTEEHLKFAKNFGELEVCLLYTSPSPRDLSTSRMPSSA